MQEIRRQLTLFINQPDGNIERIRSKYNHVQFNLIPAHVTLCREDEIEPIEKTIERLESISMNAPIHIDFGKVERFSSGKGAFIPPVGENKEFTQLRQLVLGQTDLIKKQIPHITLMHPRNSTCDSEIFRHIQKYELPAKLEFRKISLIEQINGGKWNVLQEFDITNSNVAN